MVDTPPMARAAEESGTISILVLLTSDGHVEGEDLIQSSGFADLDRERLRSARDTKYHPQIFRCVGTAGAYIFRAQFTNN
jgi:TonB family protein